MLAGCRGSRSLSVIKEMNRVDKREKGRFSFRRRGKKEMASRVQNGGGEHFQKLIP